MGPILVATDGTSSADIALRAAAQMADATRSLVTVLAVLEPLPIVAADYGLLLPPMEPDDDRRQALRERVSARVREMAGERPDWTTTILDGDPPSTIARVAREIRARVIVVGIGHHNLLSRLFGGETALHTLRLSRAPLFAVSQDFEHLPGRIAIAIDFSAPSLMAAKTALALWRDLSMVYLVHVAPRPELQSDTLADIIAEPGDLAEPAFNRLHDELAIPPGVTVETVTLTGKPARALLDFARSSNVGAIVTGSRGSGLIDRLIVGSTATALIRGASCSVLVVPSLGRSHFEAGVDATQHHLAKETWAEALALFTRRNAGRVASLDVDDPEFGAQAQQHGYPFMGAAYDHHDQRIELMLGDMESSSRHLTRGIGDVHAIDLLQDGEGHDRVLRISHGSGHTTLTLSR